MFEDVGKIHVSNVVKGELSSLFVCLFVCSLMAVLPLLLECFFLSLDPGYQWVGNVFVVLSLGSDPYNKALQ